MGIHPSILLMCSNGVSFSFANKKATTQVASIANNEFWVAEEYHQKYLEKAGQSAKKGDLSPIQCYGDRGPMKILDKPSIHSLFRGKAGEHGEL